MVLTHQFHQNFPGDTIGGHYMNRKRSKENIREAERYSKIVSGIPSVALPPRRDIPGKLPERGGGGVPPRLTLIKNVIFRVSFQIRF